MVGLCLVASAADFLAPRIEEGMQREGLTLEDLEEQRWVTWSGDKYPVSARLHREAKMIEILSRVSVLAIDFLRVQQHMLLCQEGPIQVKCPVRLLHDQNDPVAPLSKVILAILLSPPKSYSFRH